MKKLLLLSFLTLVLACSSSESDQNNSSDNFNPPQKLISSIYISSINCNNGGIPDSFLKGYNLDIYYTNNLVTGSDAFDCDLNCDVSIDCSNELVWWNQYISTGMSFFNDFPLTAQGGQYTISYNNNYIVSKAENDGTGLFHYYSWDDGKLTNITTYLNNEILFGSVDFTYSNLTNLTGLFTPAPWGDLGILFPSDPLALMGASGNITSKLPSSIVSQKWDENSGDLESVTTANFSYQIDNEGYVTSFETISPNGFKYTTTIEYQ